VFDTWAGGPATIAVDLPIGLVEGIQDADKAAGRPLPGRARSAFSTARVVAAAGGGLIAGNGDTARVTSLGWPDGPPVPHDA
jgi:hypothetical protein